MKSFLLSAVLVVATLSSCTKYERQFGCHLDNMNVKGNVTKIETIVETTIPLTELYEKSFDPSKSISMFAGNTEIDLDKRGNVKRSCGYGLDGKKLYDVDVWLGNDRILMPWVLGPAINPKNDDVKIVKNGDKAVNVKYFSNGELIWEQNAMYDKDGNIERIVKEYTSLTIKLDSLTISYKDTNSYHYSDYDNHGNWTRAKVEYKGVLPRHAHDYIIFRQLTYDGEGKHDKLIKKLASVNGQRQESLSDFTQIHMGSYGTMSIPIYMALEGKEYMSDIKNSIPNGQMIDYLFMSTYDKQDAYATILVSKTYVGTDNSFEDWISDGRTYDKELDDYLKSQMNQDKVNILKWFPYKFVKLSGKDVLKMSYYRYGNGSPIPVYCENYSIPMDDGYTLNVVISYQSNLTNRFHTDFEKAINSIELN